MSSVTVSGGSTPLTFSPSRSGRFHGYTGSSHRADHSNGGSPNSKSTLLDTAVDEFYYDTMNSDQIHKQFEMILYNNINWFWTFPFTRKLQMNSMWDEVRLMF